MLGPLYSAVDCRQREGAVADALTTVEGSAQGIFDDITILVVMSGGGYRRQFQRSSLSSFDALSRPLALKLVSFESFENDNIGSGRGSQATPIPSRIMG